MPPDSKTNSLRSIIISFSVLPKIVKNFICKIKKLNFGRLENDYKGTISLFSKDCTKEMELWPYEPLIVSDNYNGILPAFPQFVMSSYWDRFFRECTEKDINPGGQYVEISKTGAQMDLASPMVMLITASMFLANRLIQDPFYIPGREWYEYFFQF